MQAVSFPGKYIKTFSWSYLFLPAYVFIFFFSLHDYIQWQSVNFITGLLAMPVVAGILPEKKSLRYGWAAMCCSIVSVLLPLNTVLYFSFLFAVLFLVESYWGKTPFLLFLLFVFLSPVFQFFLNVFSFPLRLQLTAWASTVMNTLGLGTAIDGNIITYQGREFSVDPACLGLNMLLLSLIVAVIFLSLWQKKTEKSFGFFSACFVFTLCILLNMATNLFRIIFTVIFNIQPDTPAHDVAGLFFFFLYVVIPLYWFTGKTVQWLQPVSPLSLHRNHSAAKSGAVFHIAVLLLLSAAAYKNIKSENGTSAGKDIPADVPGYTVSCLPHQVIKLDKKNILVYIKRIPAFYNADHTPYICWKGSGYQFQQIKEEKINNRLVYTGKLVNGKDELYTCWWYQGGDKITIDQFTWRRDMLLGKQRYSVVNVSATTRKALIEEILYMTYSNPFSKILK